MFVQALSDLSDILPNYLPNFIHPFWRKLFTKVELISYSTVEVKVTIAAVLGLNELTLHKQCQQHNLFSTSIENKQLPLKMKIFSWKVVWKTFEKLLKIYLLLLKTLGIILLEHLLPALEKKGAEDNMNCVRNN
uniref:Uncharacterized protein n=1 Tax=Cacopsylla melanoneura TaxID=428564 RepID=A0A8D8RTD4_9HEMI